MARFLVHISIELPSDMAEDERAALLARERERGRALKDAGVIQDMWRLPGRLANVGIWRADSATGLHDALTSLPVWPWAQVEVTALADHYLTGNPEDAS
jgi:muconolactone D-isomerase